MKLFSAIMFPLILGGLALTGCGDADEVVDCAQICNAYENCIDSSYDVSDCIDRCETKADNDEDFASQTDECEDCLDGQSCAEATFQCATECAAIVP